MGFRIQEEEKLIKKIEKIREAKGIRPSQMARALQISHSDYNRIQRGERKLYLHEFPKIVAMLGPELFTELANKEKNEKPAGTLLADLPILGSLMSASAVNELEITVKRQLVHVKLDPSEGDEILHCLKLFIGLLANRGDRKKNLRILRKTLEGLEETTKMGEERRH